MSLVRQPAGPLHHPEVVLARSEVVADALVEAGVRAAAPLTEWVHLPERALFNFQGEATGARLVVALPPADAAALAKRLVAGGDFPLGLPEGVDLDDPAAILAGLDYIHPLGWEPLPSAAGSVDDLLAGIAVRGQVPAISTRLATLDSFLPGGWVPGLYLLGGMPGRGKTGFGLFQAIGAAQAGTPVLFVSADQGVTELLARLLCGEAGLPIGAWWQLKRADERLADLAEAGARLPLDKMHFVDDLGAAGIAGLPAVVRRLSAQTGQTPFVVVDYLQVLRPAKSEDAGQERVRIARAGDQLRQLVRSAGLRLLALSSTNRASYHEDPGLEALKGSGDLEFSADAVFLLRDAAEEDDEPVMRSLGDPLPPISLELHVLKNRFGPRTADRPLLVDFDTLRGYFSDKGIAPLKAKKKSEKSVSKRDPSPEEVARLCAESGGWSSIEDVRKALEISRERAKSALDAAIDEDLIVDEGQGRRPRWRVASSWRNVDEAF